MTRRSKFILLAILVTIGLIGASLPFWLMPEGKNVISYENRANLIRFHVIANSDTQFDQSMKRKIRDLIVAEMTPKFNKAKNITEARKVVTNNLSRMEEIARTEISQEGQNYDVNATLGRFNFPIKNYGDFTLPAGEYEAVRVVIGEGQGTNWWCVLFPPVCFHDVTKVVSNIDSSEAEPVVNMSAEKKDNNSNLVDKKNTSNKNKAKTDKNIKDNKEVKKDKEIKVKFKFVELMEKSNNKFIKKLGNKLALFE